MRARRQLGPERGGAAHQPPAEGEEVQQGAAARGEPAGPRGSVLRPDALQPHLSGQQVTWPTPTPVAGTYLLMLY